MLILSKEGLHPHTLREFLECDYPELLESAENGCTILKELQNALVELLPLSQKLLPRRSQLPPPSARLWMMKQCSAYTNHLL